MNRTTPYKSTNKIRAKVSFLFALLTFLIWSCSTDISGFKTTDKMPVIVPDYTAITLPPNIAPLNFMIRESGEDFVVTISSAKGNKIKIEAPQGKVIIPIGKWKDLLAQNSGEKLLIDLFVRQNGQWIKFQTIENQIATDPIDSYMAYRLIEPLFETWYRMGIYQRCLENFDEQPVMVNSMSDGNCMNCHSFSKNSSETMMFHMRADHGGTYIYRNGELKKVNTKTDQTIAGGVYPSWHPNGRDIAFSVNHIVQTFHAVPEKKVEVLDTLSDLILYDAERNAVSNCQAIASAERLETFPSWSPDGKYLYYCSALKPHPFRYDSVKYDLLRIAYNENSHQFGQIDTILSVKKTGKSLSFPRVSPDGKYLLFCLSNYGNFSIWHPESDLWLLNLQDGTMARPEINSDQTESYHTWSSTGRWIVFSSRRLDGLFTRPYFTYFDTAGKAHKPFLLPQEDPEFYDTFIKSYNIPELITSEIKLNPQKISKVIDQEAAQATFVKN